jgi:hypothetical protein
MTDLRDSELLIGVDGGATEVKAHQVLVLSGSPSAQRGTNGAPTLALGGASGSCCYDDVRGFEPVPLAEQLCAFDEKRVMPTISEVAEGEQWIDAIASTIGAIASEAESSFVRVGLCMPGLKTSDGRGLAVVRNGPRIPDFLDRLERRLTRAGLVIAHPIPPLLSDGDACGIGERVHAQGMLRGVANAYYIGGGTGLAETMLLAGEIVGFDALSGWMKKAWMLPCSPGRSFEEMVSMGGINAEYAQRSGKPPPVHEDEFPERRAARGEAIAIEVMRSAAEALAELVFLRIALLAKGRKLAAPREPASSATPAVRVRPRTYLERVVFGQRLAHLFADEDLHRVFRDVVETALVDRIQGARDAALASQYLEGSSLRAGFLCASSLRAAPALGAAACALGSSAVFARGHGARATVDRDHEAHEHGALEHEARDRDTLGHAGRENGARDHRAHDHGPRIGMPRDEEVPG